MHTSIIKRTITQATVVFMGLVIAGLYSSAAIANDLSVNRINPELLDDVHAVIRLDEQIFEYRKVGNGRMHVRRIVTILNSDGLSHASLEIPYHSFTKIKKLKGAVYNADGDRVKKIKGRHFNDISMVSSISLAEDSRKKEGTFSHAEYPFTVEIEYRIDYSGFIQLPAWVPISEEHTALEKGTFIVNIPGNVSADYRTFNISDEQFTKETSNDGFKYHWALTGVKGIERELYGPPWFELLPAVVFRTSDFQMDGYRGSLQTWPSFARWMGSLWEDRSKLPESVKKKIDRMVEEHGQSRELIHSIYSYLQENTRYVSIQLGIGGYQTETAISTAENRYGDCKALSNYLVSMLQYAGIEAYPALIRNGSFAFPFDTEFVHTPFNHSIVAVPFETDTLWIEATSSSFPPGYIGSSNANRHALVFQKTSGELVKTPALTPKDNFQKRQATLHLSPRGDASMKVTTQFGGSQHERVRNIARQSARRQMDYLNDRLPFNMYDVNIYEIVSDADSSTAGITMDVEISSFASAVGNRLMFYPNVLERNRSFVTPLQVRTQPVYTGASYHDTDSIFIKIPEGYTVEAIPEPVALQFEYGSYSSIVTVSDDGKTLNYIREIIMKPGILPAEEHNQFFDFINGIVRSDNNQAVLVKM